MSLESDTKITPFADALWRRVESMLTYPNDFVEQRIEGEVVIQAAVDRRGVFTGRLRSIHADDSLLGAFVLATLIKALEAPLPQNRWLGDAAPMLVVFQFNFRLIGVGELPKPPLAPHLKNILSFNRSAHVDPKINQEIEKILTRFVPPVIPLPGGFFIDFIHTYQFIKNLIKPPPDLDALRDQRIELKREELDRFIKSAGTGSG